LIIPLLQNVRDVEIHLVKIYVRHSGQVNKVTCQYLKGS
jgi:hypothetical protein